MLTARRAVGGLGIALGVGLVATTLGLSLFQRTGEAERVLDRFQPAVSPKGLPQFQSDYRTTIDGATELKEKAFPRFARDLGLTQPQFDALVRRDFAAVAAGIDDVPRIETFVDPLLARVDALPGDKFKPLFDLPVPWLPTTSMPWLMLASGLGLIGLGALTWRRPGTRMLWALAATGLALGVVPLALSLPSRTEAAARILPTLRAGLSDEFATNGDFAVRVTDALVQQVRAELLPELGRRLHLTPAQVGAVIARDYPAVARLNANWGGIISRARRNVADIRESEPDFAFADGISYEPLPWGIVGGGFLLALAAAASLAPAARRRASAALATAA